MNIFICSVNMAISPDLWSGLWSNAIGAFIGGFVALIITILTIRSQKKQYEKQEFEHYKDKQVQLLWQIFFDIKRDFESLKLWDKYLTILGNSLEPNGSPTAKYISQMLPHTVFDLKNLLVTLSATDVKSMNSDLELVWDRAGHLLYLMGKILELNIVYDMNDAIKQYKSANELYQHHLKLVAKRRNS